MGLKDADSSLPKRTILTLLTTPVLPPQSKAKVTFYHEATFIAENGKGQLTGEATTVPNQSTFSELDVGSSPGMFRRLLRAGLSLIHMVQRGRFKCSGTDSISVRTIVWKHTPRAHFEACVAAC